jgi:hypothetical protein
MSIDTAKALLSRGELNAADSVFLAMTADPQLRSQACNPTHAGAFD